MLNELSGAPSGLIICAKCADYILMPIAGWALVCHMNQRTVYHKALIGVLSFNTVFQIISAFTGWVVTVDDTGRYSHGPLYAVYIGLCIVVMLLAMAEFIYFGKKFRRRNRFSLYAIMLMYVSGYAAQVISGGSIKSICISLTISAALLFIHYSEFAQLKTDEQIASQSANILILQMRPHFIYNTMMSIYYLCEQDPKKAQQVILNFSSYLRKNFSAVANEQTIPFSEELEHAKAYLAVEQVRFEDKLFVEYDIPDTEFRLPSLTLQPIVENAVKYGVDPELNPLYIYVRTRETGSGHEITVEDTGPGFGESSNNEPHIALKNIRERLKIMCGGTLNIAGREQGGTVITIFVPDKK